MLDKIINNRIEEICLVGRNDRFSLSCTIPELLNSLKYNNSVRTIHLTNVFVAYGYTELLTLLDVFKINTSIEELNLSHNALEYKSIEILSDIIKITPSALRCIRLDSISVADSHMNIINIIAPAINLNISIQHISLSNNDLGDEGVKILAETLKVNTSITSIDLSRNKIDDEGAKALAETLKVNTSITEIYLHDNKIGYVGLEALADAIKVNSVLSGIYLSNNNIYGYNTLICLVNALQYNYTIKEIYTYPYQLSNIRKMTKPKYKKQRIIEWIPWKNHHICRELEPGFHDIVLTLLYLFFIPQIFLRREKLRQRPLLLKKQKI